MGNYNYVMKYPSDVPRTDEERRRFDERVDFYLSIHRRSRVGLDYFIAMVESDLRSVHKIQDMTDEEKREYMAFLKRNQPRRLTVREEAECRYDMDHGRALR